MNTIVFDSYDSKTFHLLSATKLVRQLTGMGLRDAKYFIDYIVDNNIDIQSPSTKKQILGMNKILVLDPTLMKKTLSEYIEEFRSFGFECDNGRKEKLKNYLQNID